MDYIYEPPKKILFTSGKGGVGKSTLSVSFAKLLAEQGNRVLLVDFDMALRTLDIMLDVGDVVLYDWYDVIEERCTPSQAVLKSGQGPDLLAAPPDRPSFNEKDLEWLIKQYEDTYDYMIFDSPAGIGRGFEAASYPAEFAFVVSTPDRICVRSAEVAGKKLKDAGIDTRLIINRFERKRVNKGRLLNIDQVIDSTGMQLIGVVPDDLMLSETAQHGRPLDKRRKGAKALERIIKRFFGEDVPLKL